jgi:hypothetical protein
VRYVRSESAYCADEISQPYSLIVVQQTPDQIAGAAAKNERRPQCRSSSSIHWMIGASPSNLLRMSVCARRQASTDAPVTEIVDATAPDARERRSTSGQRRSARHEAARGASPLSTQTRRARSSRPPSAAYPPPARSDDADIPSMPEGSVVGHHIPITGSRQPAACCTPRGTKVQIDVRINQSTEIS